MRTLDNSTQDKTDRENLKNALISNSILLRIYGNPKFQQRHRSANIKSKKKGQFTVNYDPSQKEKRDFLLIAQEKRPKQPYVGPVRVDMHCYFRRPKNHYGTGKNANKIKDSAPIYHTSKPDFDNLYKFVCDALNGIFWKDDSIICQGSFIKKYDEVPRTEIFITEIK